MIDNPTVTLLNGVALVTADVYSFIYRATTSKEINVQVSNVGTGTPIGVWRFDLSDDPAVESEFWTEQRTGTRLGSGSAAKWIPIDDPTVVQGDSLTLAAAADQKSSVAFVLGLGTYFRVWYDITSGGSASSLGTVRLHAKA